MADWTVDQIAKLRRLWTSGLSASAMVKQFDFVFSRSAILGKVNRLGLVARRAAYPKMDVNVPKPRKPPVVPRFKTTLSKPLPEPPPLPPASTLPILPPTPAPKALLQPVVKSTRPRNILPTKFYDDVFFYNWIADLSPRLRDIYHIPKVGQCKFIIGEVANISSYWCKELTGGGPWCPYHKKLVYQPAEYRKRTR